jgi:hypothetical protein
MLLGSSVMEPMIRALVPQAEIVSRPRFSTLSFSGRRNCRACRRAAPSSPFPPSRFMPWPKCCAGFAAGRRW